MDPVSININKPSFWDQFDENDLNTSPVRNFYRGKVIFLTGATGFLGQLYVEKLLRSDVERIYILTRAKKNKTPEERIASTFSGVQFSILKKYDQDFLSRLTIVEGDLAELGVGINNEALQILRENVNIVIHAGADVRFQEALIKLVLVNLRGTRELLRIAKTFKKLKSFTYISTAFSNCPKGRNIYEQFYDYPVDPDVMITLAERIRNNSEELINFETITERIIKPWPNTYTYTKCLSEEMVRRFGEHFPIIIIRPSIVISTYQEPVPAWANNIYGLNGVLVAVGFGFIRILPLNGKIIGDVICADFVINSTLAAIWATHDESDPKNCLTKVSAARAQPKIYAVCSSKDNPILWGKHKETRDIFMQSPAKSIVWTCCYNATTCPFMWKYCCLLYHFIPSMFFDIILRLQGKQLRLLNTCRKAQMFLNALIYFMQNEWIFDNSNMHSVIDRMTPTDQKLFNCDVRKFSFNDWAFTYMQGLKVYIGNEGLDETTVQAAKKKIRRINVAHFVIKIAYYACNSWLLYSLARVFGLIDYAQTSIITTYYFFSHPDSMEIL